jgi:hypothetical protein
MTMDQDQEQGADSAPVMFDGSAGISSAEGSADASASSVDSSADASASSVDSSPAAADTVDYLNSATLNAAAPDGAAAGHEEKEPSFWDNVKEFGKTAADMWPDALEVAAHLGSGAAKTINAIPAVGAIPAIINGAKDSDKASDARLDAQLHSDDKARVAADGDKDAFYKGRENYDLMTAIPLVGTAAGIGEAANGVWNWATGGKGGYKEGAESFKDAMTEQVDRVTGDRKGRDTGYRYDLRHRMEKECAQVGVES